MWPLEEMGKEGCVFLRQRDMCAYNHPLKIYMSPAGWINLCGRRTSLGAVHFEASFGTNEIFFVLLSPAYTALGER